MILCNIIVLEYEYCRGFKMGRDIDITGIVWQRCYRLSEKLVLCFLYQRTAFKHRILPFFPVKVAGHDFHRVHGQIDRKFFQNSWFFL